MGPREHTLSRLLRERGRHLADPDLFARARAEAHAAETAMAGQDNPEGLDGFDPMDDPEFAAYVQAYSARRAALRARDAELDAARAHVPASGPTDEAAIEAEAVRAVREREPILPITSPRVEAAIKRIMRDTGFSDQQIRSRFPDGDEVP